MAETRASISIGAKDDTAPAFNSIQRSLQKMQIAAETQGKSASATKLYELAVRGASAAQLDAAKTSLAMVDGYRKGVAAGDIIKKGLLAVGAVAATSLIAAAVAFDQLTKKAGDFQDMAEKTGDTAENIASLAVAAGTAGTGMDTIVSASAKLTKGLTGVDDESKAAGSAIAALGLSIKDFKALKPADQMEAVAKALNGFEDGAQKTAVAMALFGKSGADLLPFLKELGQEGGRQVILTQTQIDQADAYADKQAKLRTELGLHAQAIAVQMVGAYNAFTEALIDVAKEMLAVENGVSTLTSDNAIADFAASAATGLATLADLAFRVGQTFNYLGNNIGAAAAQADALARLDFAGSAAIGRASQDFNDGISFSLGLADKVEKRLRDAAAKTSFGGMKSGEMDSWFSKKDLNFNGPDPKAKDAASAEAKARLGLDLENIKNVYGSLIASYSDSEKIMQAMHAAGLVDEQDYYASKLGFLNLNAAAQEQDLTEQIARMEREKLIGKDRLENDRKISEAKAKLATVKASNTAGVEVNTIQSAASSTKRNTEVDKFFEDAQKAAENRNIASVESIRQSLLSQEQLETEAYAKRLEELNVYNASRLEGEASVNLLIEDEKRRHEDAMFSIKAQSDQMMLGAVTQSTDQLYNLLKQAGQEQTALGKIAFIASKGLAVAQIILSTNVAAAAALALPPLGLGPVAGLPLSGFIKAMGYASAGLTAGLAIAEASAEGGYDIPEGVNPMVQTHAKEMILPRAQANVIRDLAKNGGAADGAAKSGAITIVNNTSAKIGKVTEQRMSNGDRALIIEEAVAATAAQMSDPNSRTSRAMGRNYSLARSR